MPENDSKKTALHNNLLTGRTKKTDAPDKNASERIAELERATERLQNELKERAQAEKAQRAALTQLQLITDAGVARCTSDQRYLWVSRAYASALGREPHEIIGRPIIDVIGAEMYETMRPYMEQVLEGSSVEYEARVADSPEPGRWIRAIYQPTRDATGGVDGWVAFVFDISERKLGEEMLRSSEVRFRSLFETSQDAILLVNQETGQILGANPAACRLYGYSREEFLTLKNIDVSAELEKTERAVRESIATVPLRLHRKKDGTTFPVEISGSYFVEDNLRLHTAFIRDITRRERMEDALRESETKLRAIFDNSRDAIVVAKDGIHVLVNPAYVSLFGYESADEIVGTPLIDLIAPESRGLVMDRIRKHVEGERVPSVYELTALKKDGTRFLMEATVSYYTVKGDQFVLPIVRDITKKRRAEEEIRLLKHSIDVHYDSAYWLDRENRFIYVNEAACKTHAYTREELIGKTITVINQSATPEKMREVWAKLRKGGYLLSESVHRRKDASEFPAEILNTYVKFGGQELICAFTRDLTEKKRLEEQLRQAQKMEAVGTLAGGIAHDFNNMLAIILGNAELALDDLEGESPSWNIKQIVKASKRARDLTKQILTFSRKTDRGRKPLRLQPLLKETYQLLRSTLPTTIRMKLDILTESDAILADPSQIQQLIVNLATNAAYAMQKKGGLLTVSLEKVILTEHEQIPELPPGSYAKLSVRDTGIGMTEKVRSRAFEPFFTTKGPDKGTGMGLAVVYGIVKNHDGEITVESAPGKGSVFHVFLPVADAEVLVTEEETGKVPGGKERILLVDDEPDVLQMTAEMLKGLGYIVTTAPGGQTAWEIFKESPDKFDLVVTDQVMPDLTGMGLAEKVLKASKVPVVLFTGYSETVSPEQARVAGIADFLMKPVSKREAANTIRRVLDSKRRAKPFGKPL